MESLIVADVDGVLRVDGELDSSNVELLTQAFATAGGDVAVDLSACTYMDSSGITALLDTAQSASLRGNHLVLIAPSVQVRRLLDLCGLSDHFDIEAEPRSVA